MSSSGALDMIPGLRNFVCRAAFVATAALCGALPAAAKDVKGLWYTGGSLGYHTTQGSIPSNADLPSDPRPDYLASRETAVEDTLSYGVHAGFGLSRLVSLQLDTGWFKGDIGTVDVYLEDTYPVSTNPLNPISLTGFRTAKDSLPFEAGTLRQVPVLLSAFLRFRPDGLVHPFMGAGAGMLFMDATTNGEVHALNQRIASMRLTGIYDENGTWIVPQRYRYAGSEGTIPNVYPLTVEADDAFAWHLSAGVEYEIDASLSVVADVRYQATSESVRLKLGRYDQTNLTLFSEKLFRDDGSLKVFNNFAYAPNPLIPNDPTGRRYACTLNTIGDFDKDGHVDDLCYQNSPSSVLDDAVATFIVQGGEINLSGFVAQVGLRWYF